MPSQSLKSQAFLNPLFDRIVNMPNLPDLAKQRFLNAKAKLEQLNIASNSSLLSHYHAFTADVKFVTLYIFGINKFNRAHQILFKELASADPALSGVACSSLGLIGGDKNFKRLLRMVSTRTKRINREAIISALSLFSYNNEQRDVLIAALVNILLDTSEVVAGRVSASEGLINVLDSYDKRRKLYRHAIHAIVVALSDPDPNVRFGAVHALGQLKVKKSLSKLRVMAAQDNARCFGHAGYPGGWTVSQEAIEAIEAIEGQSAN